MTTKEWLNRGWELNDEINTLLSEQRQAFESACGVTACMGGERVQASQSNTSEKKFINYIKYSNMIDEYIDKLYGIKCEILNAIKMVEDNKSRLILLKHYIQFKHWDDMADELNYSMQHLFKLHGKALLEVSCFITSKDESK